jgi:hypothetical protein
MSINQTRIRPLSWIKRRVVKGGRRPRKVPFGLFRGLVLDLDLQHQTQVYLGLWERETYKYLRKAADRCVWMVDVGAGKGELCLYFLKNSRAEKIIAFEPQDSEIKVIRSNLALNGAQENEIVAVSNKFIGTADDPRYAALDELDVDKGKRGFIKIDVDGYETDALKSGDRLLSGRNVDLLVETHSKRLEEECIEWLDAKGYRCEIVKNAWWRFVVPEQRPGTTHNRWLWATGVG